MDFGVIYMQDKAATRAAMWLGAFIFVLFILVPFFVWWLFIPLYILLLIIGAKRKFKVDNPNFIFLFPLAPFTAALVLCLAFWWCIPLIVNLANDLFETFRSIFINSNSPIVFLKDEISDEKCYLYFILFFGGSVSSFFSIMSIACMEPLSSTKQYHKINTRSKWKWDKNDNIDAYCRALRKSVKPKSCEQMNLSQENKLFREQQYNVEKWKQRQNRKQQKRQNKHL